MFTTTGTPFVAYLSLVNGAIGPTNVAVFTNGNPFTPSANDKLYVTNITVSSSDTTQALITVDDGAATARKLLSTYLSATQPPAVVSIPPGACVLRPGVLPRGTATAVSAAKTVEIVVNGFVSKA